MRRLLNLNQGWTFTMPGEKPKAVNLPHTWNGLDGQDGGGDYKRCCCRYERTLSRPALEAGEHCILLFHGVNSEAKVFFNGSLAVEHEGGYSTFLADVTRLMQAENTISVQVNNTPNNTVYPQMADFTFYGGIYRDVELLIVPETHFPYGENAAPPLRVTAEVKGGEGVLTVQTYLPEAANANVVVTVLDREKKAVATGGVGRPITVPAVHLWQGREDPYLYEVQAELKAGEQVLDSVSCRTGFRTIRVDPELGFILNGKQYPLRGVCRHQDRPGKGNAISKADHDEDMALIEEVGATTVRLSHYQHAQYFYDLCDEKGLVVWAEIPYISKHMTTANANALSQMKDLIRQNYNHPSIVCWCISNEITIKHAGKEAVACHRTIHEFCHREDPSRYTVIACYMVMNKHNPVAHVTDLVSYNLYYGWYIPGFYWAGWTLDSFHKKYPKTPIGLSEYGAEAMPNLHSKWPRQGDNTEEYQCRYHEKMLDIIEKRDYLWATHLWNMFDFAADARDQGGEPGMNHKGLVTFDRKTKKDSFYLYKAHWSKEPFVHLCGSRFVNRTGDTTKVVVYSNQEEVTLYHNGSKVETKRGKYRFEFSIPLLQTNHLEAKSGACSDACELRKVDRPDPAYRLHKRSNNKSWEK